MSRSTYGHGSREMFNVKLSSGFEMPILGFGTFLSAKGEVGNAIKAAIRAGYRSIDCAFAYENEKEIGDALQELYKEKVVKREDLFITSKLAADYMIPEEVEKAIRSSISDLQCDYLDLYLLHQPVPVERKDGACRPRRLHGLGLQDIWRQMESIQKKALTRSIGVSNFNAQTLNDMLNYSKIPPAVLQIERHPYLQQPELLKFCRENHVHITAYGSLGSRGLDGRPEFKEIPDLIDHEVIKKIAHDHTKTAAQILLRWSIDSGVICIPKSVKEERIKENFNVFDFNLNEKEMSQIEPLGKVKLRIFLQDWAGVPTFC